MTTATAQEERRGTVAEVDEESKPLPYLERVLNEIERANAQREEPAKRPRTTERAPHPFAYD